MAGDSKMAGPTRHEVAKEVEKLLSIWPKLKDNDKQNCKQLIDSKIRKLRDYKHGIYETPYSSLETALSLKDKLVGAKFDLGSISLEITKEMEDLMVKNGLQYAEAAEDQSSTAPRFEVRHFTSEYFTPPSGPKATYFLRYEEEKISVVHINYRYSLYQIQEDVKTNTGASIEARTMKRLLENKYEREGSMVVFRDDEGSITLSLHMSSHEQAIAFLEHAVSQNIKWSEESLTLILR